MKLYDEFERVAAFEQQGKAQFAPMTVWPARSKMARMQSHFILFFEFLHDQKNK